MVELIIVLAVIVTVVAVAVFLIQERARWRREEEGDDAWVAELKLMQRIKWPSHRR